LKIGFFDPFNGTLWITEKAHETISSPHAKSDQKQVWYALGFLAIFLRTGLGIAFFAITAQTAFAATTWNLSADCSITNNPNGQWSYGSTSNINVTDFTLMNYRWGTTGWYLGNVGIWDPSVHDQGNMWAGNNAAGYPVFRWTAPNAGEYTLNGAFYGADSRGVSNFVYITVDGNVQFNSHLVSPTDSATFSLDMNLSQGSTINFLTAWDGGLASYGSCCWVSTDATIAPVPIPTALWLFGSALTGLIGLGRRQIL